MKRGNPEWKGCGAAGLLHGIRFQVERTKPVSPLEQVSCFFASSYYTTVKSCFSSNIFMPRVAVR